MSLATTPAQVVISEEPKHTKWKIQNEEVLCFVKERANSVKYSLQLYDLYHKKIWEDRVHRLFEIKMKNTYF